MYIFYTESILPEQLPIYMRNAIFKKNLQINSLQFLPVHSVNKHICMDTYDILIGREIIVI